MALGQPELLGGAAEAAQVRHAREDAEFIKIHNYTLIVFI